MKSIIKWNFWQRRISTIWWSVGIAFFMFINMIFYPSFKDQAAELQKSFESMPDAAIQFIGGSTDFFSPIGYVNSQIFFLTLPLILVILAISLGSRLLASEETDKTIESIMSRPISRTNFLISKAAVGEIILLLVTFVSWATVVVVAKVVGLDVSILRLTEATLVCFLFVYLCGAVAYMMTAIGKAKGASIAVATFVAFGGYILTSLAGTVEWLKWPAKLFPFEYYQSEAILRGTYNWQNLWYFVFTICACGLISWLSFRRRDLEK
jgi:ABC-2 type transport system permease protein